MTVATKTDVELAVIERETGEIMLDLPTSPTLSLETAERVFSIAQQYKARLTKLIDVAKATIEAGWTARQQSEGILGGVRYELKAKPGTWQYNDALYDALLPFAGRVFTEDDLVAATGRTVIPAHVEQVPEMVFYAHDTAKVDALARKSKEVEVIVTKHRDRDPGTPSLQKKK